MTSEGNGQHIEYRVILPVHVKDHVVQLHQEEIKKGTGHKFVASLRHIYERLPTKPNEFGEPLFHLPSLELIVHQAIFDGIIVDFAIHLNQPIVFVRGLTALT